MSEPIWLTHDLVVAAHDEGLAIFGGGTGVRDEGLLASALGRPHNQFACGTADLTTLSAAYAFGLARNHPFVDGNKRAALSAIFMFLGFNDLEFAPDETAAVLVIEGLADGRVSEAEPAEWIAASD